MTKEELIKLIDVDKMKPKQWRRGQYVFNYIDNIFNVARDIQFKDGIDCFYNDEYIDDFIEAAVKRINNG